MKNVNVKLFALKYKLIQKLTKSLENDKEAIKNGAKLTMEKYANVKQVECTRKAYSKEAQEKLDKFAQENGIEKQETKYIRIEIDNISIEIDKEVDKVIETLENTNDKTMQKVASKVKNTKWKELKNNEKIIKTI